MHAVVIRNRELYWEEREDPIPASTELLVEVQAAGLNGADIMQRAGHYPAPPGSPPDIPGMELSGTVVAAGTQVQRFTVGDRIMAVIGGGAQAELALVDEAHAMAVPDGVAWAEAGGFPEVFWTAYDALFTQAELKMGDRVLVSGAAGGVGTAGVQLAALAGATVIATVRDQARHDEVAALGAAVVIDPSEVADHGPYDVVLELVGAASLPTVIPHLATQARVIVIGVGSGATIELNLLALMGSRARIGGATLRARSRSQKAQVAAAVTAHVLPLLAAGRIRIPVCATFPMAEATAAYERFTSGSKLGKVVLLK